jgi:hypothetical protein
MIKINEFLDEVKSYCDFYLEYDQTNHLYKFNSQFVDEIYIESFDDKIIELKNKLIDVLIDIKKPKVLLKDVFKELAKITDWYELYDISDFKTFDEVNRLIVTSTNNPIYNESIEYSLAATLESIEISEKNSDSIFGYLIYHKLTTNNYCDPGDFEKVKLHFILLKYFQSIYSLVGFLLMLEGVLYKYGITDYDQFRPTPSPKLRCTINLSKIESANLFNLLYRQGIFTFDLKSDVKREKAELDFINENFNYINPHGKVVKMTNVIKEFGEIKKFHYNEGQKKILDSLIDTLTTMRQNLDTIK